MGQSEDIQCARLFSALVAMPAFQAHQYKRLLLTSKRVCSRFGRVDLAPDVAQNALIRAIERGEDLWEWSNSALRYTLLDNLRSERARTNTEVRWSLNRRKNDGAIGGDSVGSRAALTAGRSKRWVDHKKPTKPCELCGKVFEAVDSKGVANKRKRFCSKSCACRFARGVKPMVS